MRIKYIRDNGHPIACIVSENGKIGIAVMSNGFNKAMARHIAFNRVYGRRKQDDCLGVIPNLKISPYRDAPKQRFTLLEVVQKEVQRMKENYQKFQAVS